MTSRKHEWSAHFGSAEIAQRRLRAHRGDPRGKALAPQCLRPRFARFSRLANKQTCDFSLLKSVFFRHFFATRQRNGIKANRSARAERTQYERPAAQIAKTT